MKKSFPINLGILTDVSGHLNRLNKQLQGKDKLVCELFENVMSFKDRLKLFISQVREEFFTHFSATAKFSSTDPKLAAVKLIDCLQDLIDEFK